VSELDDLRADLIEEQSDLDTRVSGLTDSQWSTPTPSVGWSVRDQIAHLTYFDGTASLAISDPDAFADGLAALMEAARTEGVDNYTLGALRQGASIEVLEAWRLNRARLVRAAATLEASDRVPWYGPSMGAMSFLTARLMEAWAHGQDVLDALGQTREPTTRLRHICRLGYNTRAWSYTVRGQSAPDGPVRVSLEGPTGRWAYGDQEATEFVEGPAEDFCLVVTQRRHLNDTSLRVSALAREWLLQAQAFAGGPTSGPAPRSS
jgi:uncharacterized protein (TIGR03084 family)